MITQSRSTQKDKMILDPLGHDFFNRLHLSSVSGLLYTVSLVSHRQLSQKCVVSRKFIAPSEVVLSNGTS